MEEEGTALILATRDGRAEAMDTRPDSSPYTGPYVSFYFKDGPPLSVPNTLLDKFPMLSSLRNSNRPVEMRAVPSEVGHVLVHYILTGTYQCLQPKGSSPNERSAAEFATSVQVYVRARKYDLPALETLAKGEMERLGRHLPVTQLLNLMTDKHPTRWADDVWLYNFIKSCIKPLMESSTLSPIDGPPQQTGQSSSLASVLLECMIDICREKNNAKPISSSHLATNKRQNEPAVVSPSKKRPALNPKPLLGGYQALMPNASNGGDSTTPQDLASRDSGLVAVKQPDKPQETPFPNNPPHASPFDRNVQHSPFASTSASPNNTPGNPFGGSWKPNTHSAFGAFGAARYQDIPDLHCPGQIQRFEHICIQQQFAGFSPEELRLNHGLSGQHHR